MTDWQDLDRLTRNVPVHRHPTGPSYVRLADIPQPWRERFLAALCGSQVPVVEGQGVVAYETDWVSFLKRAMRRLQAEHIATILKAVQVGPLPTDLEAAPILDPWCVMENPGGELCLHGAVSGHPLLPGQGRWVATSMLIGLDLEAAHARTVSRWYRLGRLVSHAECDTLRGRALNPAFRPAHVDDVMPWSERLRAFVANEGFDV